MMNKSVIFIIVSILLGPVVKAAEKVKMRYMPQNNNSLFTINQQMEIGPKGENHFERAFTINFILTGKDNTNQMIFTVEKAKGSFSAHGQTMGLPSNQVLGKSLALNIATDGLTISSAYSENQLSYKTGPIIEKGFQLDWAVLNLMPVLPKQAVHKGTHWSSEKDIHSLQGWSWTEGTLSSKHKVTAIEKLHGSLIVSVETESQGSLIALEGDRAYEADGLITSKANWKFDATQGRLLSISIEQNSKGVSEVPQGRVLVTQKTDYVFSTAD